MIIALGFVVAFLALFQGMHDEHIHLTRFRINNSYKEAKYQHKVHKAEDKARAERGVVEFDGYATVEDYELLSRDVASLKKEVKKPEYPENLDMAYIPQPTYKLKRYNDPPGSVEINIERNAKFDRSYNGAGVADNSLTYMAYPVVNYNARVDNTTGDIYFLMLDKSLPDVEKLQYANVTSRINPPILSTSKNIDEMYHFRTMTPIDFSVDASKLIAKEKIGYTWDGIWQTNLWVYDFETKQAKELVEVREAIKHYWKTNKDTELNDKMWDIYPLGFDLTNPNNVIVLAYAFTGERPRFLGSWSVDVKGERTMLLSLHSKTYPISINGFKLVKDSVVIPSKVGKDRKAKIKQSKQDAKAAKKEKKARDKAYAKEIHDEIKRKDIEFKAKEKFYKDKNKKMKVPTSGGEVFGE